jgi:hypothetical protein
MSVLTISFASQCERSFESQGQNRCRTGLKETGEIMWRINSAATELNLRARTLCFIVFLVLSGEACIYFVVRQFVSEI